MRASVRMAAGTAAFALAHSALASRRAKALAARVVGTRARDGLYRGFFVAQSLVTFGALLAWGARQPARTLYRVHGPLAWTLRAGQGAGLLYALLAARQVGIARLAGLEALAGWARGGNVPHGPAAQGPEADGTGRLTIGGPFLWSRHPLNLAPLPLFWLTPRLTTRRLAFNLVSTAYMVLGSLHEERRLRAEYGERYEAYRRSGIPFYLPRPRGSGSRVGGPAVKARLED